jgi:hypothetical protein
MKLMIKKFVKMLMFGMMILTSFLLFGCTDEELTVIGIEITSNPTKVVYTEGEVFDPTGLEIKKIMSNDTKVVIDDYSIDKVSALSTNDTKVTITWGDFTVSLNITVKRKIKTVEEVELRVEENCVYNRSTDVYDKIEYREIYSDDTYGTWNKIAHEDIKSYRIDNNELVVEVSLYLYNQEYIREVRIPLNTQFITLDQFLAKPIDDQVYMVQGVLVSIATTMTRVEYIIQDKTSGAFIGVSKLALTGSINDYNLDVSNFDIGDEIIIPLKKMKSTAGSQNSDKDKVYAEYCGGSLYQTAVVSKNNKTKIDKSQIVTISNQEELVSFLTEANRANNFYKIVKLRGELNYIYYANAKYYRFFFDKTITTLKDQLIDNCSPVFANGNHHYTVGKTVGELIFDNENFAPTSWSSPAKATKEITALFIGGNTYYHHFVVLNQSDVAEVVPELLEVRFSKPTNLVYMKGDILNLTGAKLIYVYDYSENVEVAITTEMLNATTLPNMNVASDYTITGQHDGHDFSFKISVIDKNVETIELVGDLAKTKYHLRDNLETVKDELVKLKIKATYNDASIETIDITENMVVSSDEWGLGLKTLQITYMNKTINIPITVENQGLSVSEFKTLPASETAVDLYGVIISSVYISGTAASPANPEILIKDKNTNDVVGIKGIYIDSTNKLAGFSVGDEILIKVVPTVTSVATNVSETGKIAAYKSGSEEIILLSKNNNHLIELSSATVIYNQEQLVDFLKNAETRQNNFYKLIKLSAGAKIVNYSMDTSSSYITYDGMSTATTKIDGIAPFLHQMNETMTLDNKTYLELLFSVDTPRNTNYETPNALEKDVYLMYVGGQGIYYHQFVLLGEEYLTTTATKNLKEIKFTAPTKISYNVGETLDLSGGKIEYEYYYAPHNQTIVLDATLITSEPVDTNIKGIYTIKFTHNGQIYSYDIIVTEEELVSIEVQTMPTKTVYSHREGVADLDLLGGELKLNYSGGGHIVIDMTNDMLPATESPDWKLGEVSYVLTYKGKTTQLKVTYENQALSIGEFKQATGTHDVTGIVVGPNSVFGTSELLIKDKSSNEIIGIWNSGITGSYNDVSLDTTVLNVGDEIIITLKKVIVSGTSDVNVGKHYGNAINAATFKENLIIVSHNNPVQYTFVEADIVTISTQAQLTEFLNSSDRFYKYVKLVGVKAVNSKGSLRIFFDGVTSLAEQKVVSSGVSSSPFIYVQNSNWHLEAGHNPYFQNNTSTDYADPASTTYEIIALYVGGNKYQLVFTILDDSWLITPES